MQTYLRAGGALLIAVVTLCAFSTPSRSSKPIPNAALPAGWAGDAACTDCHDAQGPGLQRTAHALGVPGARTVQVHCESCHGAGARHAADPGASALDDLKKGAGGDPNPACMACHALASEEGASQHQHASHGLRCTDCHSVHAST